MNERAGKRISRRALIKGSLGVIGVAAIPVVASREALAAAKVPKSVMKYQDHPSNGHDCTGCVHFIPGPSPTAMGQCKVVAGAISPKGWCIAWSPKV